MMMMMINEYKLIKVKKNSCIIFFIGLFGLFEFDLF